MQKQKLAFTVSAVAILLMAFALGMYVGKNRGASETQKALEPILNLAFPKPSGVLENVQGKILSLRSDSLVVEVPDPEDYLPHTDRSPQKKLTRTVSVGGETKIILIDYTHLDSKGKARISSLELGSLRVGDIVTIRSNSNIRSTETFQATSIELPKY